MTQTEYSWIWELLEGTEFKGKEEALYNFSARVVEKSTGTTFRSQWNVEKWWRLLPERYVVSGLNLVSLFQTPPPMTETYIVVNGSATLDSVDAKELASFLARDGQMPPSLVGLVEETRCAIDDLIDDLLDVMGRAAIEAVLRMSAGQHFGPRRQRKASDREVAYHGSQ